MHQRETVPAHRNKPPARFAIIRFGKKKFSTPKENLPPQRPFSARRRSEVARTISLSRTKQPLFVPRRPPLPTCRPDKNVVGQPTTGREKSHRDTDPARDGAHPAVMARRNTKRPSATRQQSRQRTASPHGKRCPRPVARQKKPDAPNEKGARSDSGHLGKKFHAAISAVFTYTCRYVS